LVAQPVNVTATPSNIAAVAAALLRSTFVFVLRWLGLYMVSVSVTVSRVATVRFRFKFVLSATRWRVLFLGCCPLIAP
jgi:hypothetical protein